MTVLLIIGGVIASLAIFNGVYPSITESAGSIRSATAKVSDRIESRIDIIQVGDNGATVEVWIKNIGISEITNIDHTDIFFGSSDDFQRIDYGGPSLPYWEYQLEGSNPKWGQAVTLKVTIHLTEPLTTGSYLVKVVIPNGISDQTTYNRE